MPITDLTDIIPVSQIDTAIARDAEYIAADTAHINATDPHAQYMLQSEGDARYLGISAKAADSELVDGIDSSRIVFGSDWSKAMGAFTSAEDVLVTSGFIDCYAGGGNLPPNMGHIMGFQIRHGNSTSLWGMQTACQHNINNEFYFRTVYDGTFNPWRRIWNDGNFNPGNYPQFKRNTYTLSTGSTQGAVTSTPHNLDATRIQSFSAFAFVNLSNSAGFAPRILPGGLAGLPGYYFSLNTDLSNITCRLHPTDSAQMLNKLVSVVIDWV